MLHLIGTIYIEGLIVYYVPKTLPPPPKLHMKIVPPLVIKIKCSPSLPPPPPPKVHAGEEKLARRRHPKPGGVWRNAPPETFLKI